MEEVSNFNKFTYWGKQSNKYIMSRGGLYVIPFCVIPEVTTPLAAVLPIYSLSPPNPPIHSCPAVYLLYKVYLHFRTFNAPFCLLNEV